MTTATATPAKAPRKRASRNDKATKNVKGTKGTKGAKASKGKAKTAAKHGGGGPPLNPRGETRRKILQMVNKSKSPVTRTAICSALGAKGRLSKMFAKLESDGVVNKVSDGRVNAYTITAKGKKELGKG